MTSVGIEVPGDRAAPQIAAKASVRWRGANDPPLALYGWGMAFLDI